MIARRTPFALAAIALLMAGGDAPTPDHAPTPAARAPSRMTIPPGFVVKPFAAEPDVVQPIAFTIDPRGRLWVVENFSYPIWLNGPVGKDRVVIFEDSDGDGAFDSRKVFYEGGTNLTGIELGFGGVWLCSTPNLLFVPDADGDDAPDGPARVVLDGWDVNAQHNMFNGLKWGPDGWLWGCNGILSNSRVGRPGAPDAGRVAINTGVWRYHPTRQVFEAVAHGTTNPWGLDFDDHGEAFITNCVIPHLFHVVPGARYDRMFGEDFNPHTYERVPTCADHLHWAGGHWTESREGAGHDRHDLAGGGHAHVGAMIYLADQWPESYRGGLYTFNIHGHRVNHDSLERKGSSYVARHQPDVLRVDDVWFRGLELKYGPDGGVFFTDWSDIGECHENDADGSHRENGRIYKMTHGDVKPVKVDLARLSDAELVALQDHKNEWYVRTARRLLQERAEIEGHKMDGPRAALRRMLDETPDTPRRLRALWALNAIGGLDAAVLTALLADRDESMRGWAVRLLVETAPVPHEVVDKLAEMADGDPSPRVRLALASALLRIPASDYRRPLARALAVAEIDPADRMLALMTWYAIESEAATSPEFATEVMPTVKLPMLREFLARRLVSADPAKGLAALAPALNSDRDDLRSDVLDGVLEALRGRKQVPRPEGWGDLYAGLSAVKSPELLDKALLLAVILDEPRAVEALRALLLDPEADAERRATALATLTERRVPGLGRDLPGLLDDSAIRARVIRAMAAFGEPDAAKVLLDRYATLSPTEREDAVAALASRPAWALALLDAIAHEAVPRRDVSVTVARQIQALNDPALSKRLEAVWGTVRATSADKAALIGKYKAILGSGQPDPAAGRAVYERTCNACHKLFDAGGDVGPELTGSDRANPDYILENVLDPSATVANEYTVTNVATADGRLVSGILRSQTPAVLTIQTANERVLIPTEDVEEVKRSNLSMMPEGQLETLSEQEIRDLFAYLASPSQVAPPK
jgi:putative membrane-bound dehydrogenase-like protein